MIGQTLGHHRIERELGAGGMGGACRATARKIDPRFEILDARSRN